MAPDSGRSGGGGEDLLLKKVGRTEGDGGGSPFGRAKAVAPTAAPLYEAVRGAAARGGAAATQASRTRARLSVARAAGKRRTAAAARRKTGAAEVGATAAAE